MSSKQLCLFDDQEKELNRSEIVINRQRFLQLLETSAERGDIAALRESIGQLKEKIESRADKDALFDANDGGAISFREDILLSELDQILESRTLQRAQYYIERLKASSEKVKTSKINDINLLRWKEYDDILTDSLWIIKRRDTSGAHLGSYWGNFIPQIPHQMMLRYTKHGEWVLDTFAGSGTTLIECRRLGRNGIGVELNAEVASRAQELVSKEPNSSGVASAIIVGDSTQVDYAQLLQPYGIDRVQLVLMHPPYHDIIRFSDNPRDLSNASSVEAFLELFGKVVDRVYPVLENGRYLAVVIGDKYAGGEWVPLGFYVMQEVLKRGFTLKSIVVKNFDETRAKRQQQELWRYRALVGGFYVFKHEYVLLFRKMRRKDATAKSQGGSEPEVEDDAGCFSA